LTQQANIDVPVNRVGNGLTFTLMSGICIFFSPIMFIVMRFGPKWRQENAAAQMEEVAKLAARKI
jgi:hypothetical protein